MKYTDAEIIKIARECAAYLIEKKERDLFNRGRASPKEIAKARPPCLPPTRVFHNYDGIMSELDSAEKEARKAWERVQRLLTHFEMGELVPFDNCSPEVRRAYEALMQGWLDIKRAQEITMHDHPPGTRSMDLQKSAVRLADGYCGVSQPRRVRSLAKRIMIEANLPPVDEKSITTWINEMRNGK